MKRIISAPGAITMIVLMLFGCVSGVSARNPAAGGSALATVTAATTTPPDNSEAKALLVKVQKAYQAASYLSYHVRYLYTNAGGVAAMDSVAGDLQVDKNRCRMVLAGTETVSNDRYLIQVSSEDRSIYLSRSQSSSMVNPVQMIDTVFARINHVRATVSGDGRSKTIIFDFPPGGMYDRIRMDIDAVSGYFQHISYSLHTANFVGKEQIDQPGHPGAYQTEGKVDMYFSGYAKGAFGDTVFDETKFFTRVAGRIEPTDQYSDYHIFLASSNL